MVRCSIEADDSPGSYKAIAMDKSLKLYYSIREVAEEMGIPEHTLRFWEKEIKQLKPKKTTGGTRQYTREDIELVKLIHHLVKEQGLTLKAAQARLKTSRKNVVSSQEIAERLKAVRDELLMMKAKLEELSVNSML